MSPEALVAMGIALVDAGEGAKAAAIAREALRQRPDDVRLQQAATLVLSRTIPHYHVPMLCDEPRNQAYEAAIKRAAASSKQVLDIGSGSGILAMMAARAGAGHVIGCEVNPMLAEAAGENVSRNGLQERVRILARRSTELQPTDLPQPADLIVTETFGHDLVGEGALESIADAVARLATPNVRVIPARGMVMVALAEFPRRPANVQTVCGLDVSAINQHDPGYWKLEAHDPAIRLRSAPRALFTFDFAQTQHAKDASVELVSDGGPVTGLVQWLRLELDDRDSFEPAVNSGSWSHFKCVCWPVPADLQTIAGDRLIAHGFRFKHHLRSWVEEGASAG